MSILGADELERVCLGIMPAGGEDGGIEGARDVADTSLFLARVRRQVSAVEIYVDRGQSSCGQPAQPRLVARA